MTKRMMAEREGEITRVQDTKCKTMLVRNTNERMREKECVCVCIHAYVHYCECVFVHMYAYLCNCASVRSRVRKKKNDRKEGLARKERGGKKGEGVIFIVRM